MLSRRQFLTRSGATGAALVIAPQTALEALAAPRGFASRLLRGGRFRQGVLSGDPTPRGITLLTVLDDVRGAGSVRLEVARDSDFRRVVARRTIATSGRRGHSVKARLEGLRPHERYWYRFETRDEESPVGRFQTALPEDSDEPVRFAFFSCAEYTHGYYNAYEVMRRDDVDFVVCLGDYVYGDAYHSRRGGTGVRDDRIGREPLPGNREQIVREAVTLEDYRSKYALYRSDRALRRLHARFPMVAVWDDHEVQDNYAGRAPGGGLDAAKRFSARRRRAAYKAYFEAMPFFPRGGSRIYRAQRHGRTMDLMMLDQRQYRADQPCGDAVVPPCDTWDQPRAFLGRAQMDWLKRRLSGSRAAWKVIGSQTLMMPARVTGGAFYTYDFWNGYPREREELLAHIRDEGIRDVVFITGDIHLFLAGDVRTSAGESVALEFVGGSITSTNFGEMDIDAGGGTVIQGDDRNPSTDPAIVQALRDLNPWVDQGDFDHHGYARVTASQDAFGVTLERVATIKRRLRRTLPRDGFQYQVARGQTSIKGVNGPP
ncbi:MAG: alkaline phosphatase D family protein [Solirubrobacteraceae bacterium]